MRHLLLTLLAATLLVAQPPQGGGNQPEYIRNAQRLLRENKFDEAIAIYNEMLLKEPNNVAALNASGVALDLAGRTKEARQRFQRVADNAPTPAAKFQAIRNIAMSYAFDNDCGNTWKSLQQVYDYWVAEKNFYQQGEMANEAARVCIEAGNYKEAERLYRLGYDSGMKEPNIAPDRVALWKFRMAHAEARLAARRGNKAEAQKKVTEAKAILDATPGMSAQQTPFYYYLAGYVALYTGDLKTASEELLKANQNDAFIQCLLGMTYEKMGDKAKAREYFEKAYTVVGHNPPAAYAKPFARKKLS